MSETPYSPHSPHSPHSPLLLEAAENCWLPRGSRTPALARRLLRGLLASVEGGHRFVETGELLLSELATNAVTHSRAPGRLIFVDLHANGERLRIEVHDAGGSRPELAVPAPEDEHGRGLLLVNTLAKQWGCTDRPNGPIGKIAWCEVGPDSLAAYDA
ncbi:ATP-binding protein [Kitasatospora sp. NBC_01287]|uniref:ATP-binding protein n=1 Tax=Kitasatospora sp. NBC_01287 TaxID=2903573 RepID=UPI00225A946B|nr:ATP-binding protein [Kitasatospora sp. NBC_01287]MCX4747832.1 ATP-binding protein [Kitasatospora sp. NBC_01287]